MFDAIKYLESESPLIVRDEAGRAILSGYPYFIDTGEDGPGRILMRIDAKKIRQVSEQLPSIGKLVPGLYALEIGACDPDVSFGYQGKVRGGCIRIGHDRDPRFKFYNEYSGMDFSCDLSPLSAPVVMQLDGLAYVLVSAGAVISGAYAFAIENEDAHRTLVRYLKSNDMEDLAFNSASDLPDEICEFARNEMGMDIDRTPLPSAQ